MIGKVHSLETFGTVDGPGTRFVLFLKGCPLRCKYCHNPDTWTQDDAKEYTIEEIVQEILKYKKYYSNGGGITVSGGEPLLQMDFIIELFKVLKKHNIHTAIDTSGYLYNKEQEYKFNELIKVTDLFLLDIKHIVDEEHKKLTGKTNKNTLDFAKYLNKNNKKMWIRYVLIPEITTKDEYIEKLKIFIDTLDNVEKVEILPYHTMGVHKYKELGIDYPLKGVLPPEEEMVKSIKFKLKRR